MDLRTKSVQLKIIHKAFWTPGMVLRVGGGRTQSGNGNKRQMNRMGRGDGVSAMERDADREVSVWFVSSVFQTKSCITPLF